MERVTSLVFALVLLAGAFGPLTAQDALPPGIEVKGIWRFNSCGFAGAVHFTCKNRTAQTIHLLPVARVQPKKDLKFEVEDAKRWASIRATSYSCAPGAEISFHTHFLLASNYFHELQLAFCDIEPPADAIVPGTVFETQTLAGSNCVIVPVSSATIEAVPWSRIPPTLGPTQTEWFETVQKLQGLEVLRHWVEKRLKNGETTLDEAVRIFGDPMDKEASNGISNLDRPDRDKLISLQFPIPNYHLYTHLVLHFDPDSKKLIETEVSYAICGFCPHVYAFDGNWRLEGKMLAGCIGSENSGTDTLLLPRLRAENGALRIKVANLAPEIEFVRDLKLASIPLQAGEELDTDSEGNPVVWTPTQEFAATWENGAVMAPAAGSQVLVLEVKNSAEFETAMRRVFLDGQEESRETNLSIHFDNRTVTQVRPVGTKLLRRVVVEIPPGATQARIVAEGDFWSMRRFWTGAKGNPERTTAWSTSSPQGSITLHPMEEQVLEFPAPAELLPAGWRWAYALRMSGYYDFVPEIPTQ